MNGLDRTTFASVLFHISLLTVVLGTFWGCAQHQDAPSKELLENLLSQVKDGGIEAKTAVRTLTALGTPAVPTLIEALSNSAAKGDPKDQIKRDIAVALGTLRDRSAIEPLTKLLYHKEKSVREDSYAALTQLHWTPAAPIDKVLVLLTVERTPYRVDQCLALGRDAISPCIALLKHPDDQVRMSACMVLALLKDDMAVAPLVDLLVTEHSSRKAAGVALAKFGTLGAIPLRELLLHPDSKVRTTAAECLGGIDPTLLVNDERTVRALVAALKDRDEPVQEQALHALGHVRSKMAVEAICEDMQVKGQNTWKRTENAVAALANIGQLSVAPLINLIDTCAKSQNNLVFWYARALGQIGSAEAVDTLNKVASSAQYEKRVCEAAIDALATIGKPALLPVIALMSDERTAVRCEAIKGLRTMHRKQAVTDGQAIVALIARLEDEDEDVRNLALDVVKLITGAETASDVFIQCIYSRVDAGRQTEALPIAMSYQQYVEKHLSIVLSFSSERQRLGYMDEMRNVSHPYCMLVATGGADGLARSVLRLKGITLDSSLEDFQVAVQSMDPLVAEIVTQLRQAKNDVGVKQKLSFDHNKRIGQLESQLAEHFAVAGKTRRAFQIIVPEVQAELAKDVVLLEFIRYPHYLSKNKAEPRYGVVLIGNPQMPLKDAKPGEPVWVPLGTAEAIEKSLKEYGSMMRGARESGISLLHKLYTQLFEPIQKRLPKDITTLIISPDAELNFVSFATFINDQDKFLAEQYAIEYVASGRDLVLKRTGKKTSRRFVAFANPAFGEKPMLAGTHSTNAVQLAMLSSDLRDYRGEKLKPLPYTMKEAQFLRDRSSSWNMDGSVYAGAEATEVEVKAVKSPYILHLATHGFFLPDTMTTNSTTGRQLLGNDRTPIVPHNPMQRSGLAFAGAQLTLDAWKRGETPDTENDGILMGQEIGTMDLKETWLVVLSACDTGIGEARAGEGVLGLRRGFIQAGAQNLLMTLWPVSDQWTVDLMKAFYERALKDNNAPQALAEVQRQWLVRLRQEEDILTAARRAGPFILTFQGSN